MDYQQSGRELYKYGSDIHPQKPQVLVHVHLPNGQPILGFAPFLTHSQRCPSPSRLIPVASRHGRQAQAGHVLQRLRPAEAPAAARALARDSCAMASPEALTPGWKLLEMKRSGNRWTHVWKTADFQTAKELYTIRCNLAFLPPKVRTWEVQCEGWLVPSFSAI